MALEIKHEDIHDYCRKFCECAPFRDLVLGTSHLATDLCASLALPLEVTTTSLLFLQQFINNFDVYGLELPLVCGSCVLLAWKYWEDFDNEMRSVRKLNDICRQIFKLLMFPVEDSEDDSDSGEEELEQLVVGLNEKFSEGFREKQPSKSTASVGGPNEARSSSTSRPVTDRDLPKRGKQAFSGSGSAVSSRRGTTSDWRLQLEPLSALSWTFRDEGKELNRVKDRIKLYESALLRCIDFEVGPILLPLDEVATLSQILWISDMEKERSKRKSRETHEASMLLTSCKRRKHQANCNEIVSSLDVESALAPLRQTTSLEGQSGALRVKPRNETKAVDEDGSVQAAEADHPSPSASPPFSSSSVETVSPPQQSISRSSSYSRAKRQNLGAVSTLFSLTTSSSSSPLASSREDQRASKTLYDAALSQSLQPDEASPQHRHPLQHPISNRSSEALLLASHSVAISPLSSSSRAGNPSDQMHDSSLLPTMEPTDGDNTEGGSTSAHRASQQMILDDPPRRPTDTDGASTARASPTIIPLYCLTGVQNRQDPDFVFQTRRLEELLHLAENNVVDYYRSPFCLLSDPISIGIAAVWKASIITGFYHSNAELIIQRITSTIGSPETKSDNRSEVEDQTVSMPIIESYYAEFPRLVELLQRFRHLYRWMAEAEVKRMKKRIKKKSMKYQFPSLIPR